MHFKLIALRYLLEERLTSRSSDRILLVQSLGTNTVTTQERAGPITSNYSNIE